MVDIAVRCTLRSGSLANADDAINTFAVTGATPGTDDALITDAFDFFYNGTQAEPALAVSSFIGATQLRTAGLRVELIATPGTIPNAPYYSALYSLEAANDGGLPLEVATCLSFFDAGYLTDANPGRHRGRVYIGPLTVDAMLEGDSALPAAPTETWINLLQAAAANLATDLSGGGREWAIWSRADSTFRPIVGGWIDDEFDTQRRRGRSPVSRSYWTA